MRNSLREGKKLNNRKVLMSFRDLKMDFLPCTQGFKWQLQGFTDCQLKATELKASGLELPEFSKV